VITIVDYGIGNLGSIYNMFKKIGINSKITCDPDEINKAEKLVLPGVGAFDHGMQNLMSKGIIQVLNEKVLGQKIPILGLCLGMQLFTRKSEEGILPGLGWIDAETIAFRKQELDLTFRVPHMGWNYVQIQRESPFFDPEEQQPRFYFVHSYHVVCFQQSDVIGVTNYGYPFVSFIQHGNIIGTQFHPEKSHKFGMRLLKQFGEAT
jgi:imidazole glycerol-phosphate synthase subunit HisH